MIHPARERNGFGVDGLGAEHQRAGDRCGQVLGFRLPLLEPDDLFPRRGTFAAMILSVRQFVERGARPDVVSPARDRPDHLPPEFMPGAFEPFLEMSRQARGLRFDDIVGKTRCRLHFSRLRVLLLYEELSRLGFGLAGPFVGDHDFDEFRRVQVVEDPLHRGRGEEDRRRGRRDALDFRDGALGPFVALLAHRVDLEDQPRQAGAVLGGGQVVEVESQSDRIGLLVRSGRGFLAHVCGPPLLGRGRPSKPVSLQYRDISAIRSRRGSRGFPGPRSCER